MEIEKKYLSLQRRRKSVFVWQMMLLAIALEELAPGALDELGA